MVDRPSTFQPSINPCATAVRVDSDPMPVLWQVASFGAERWVANSRYWNVNSARRPVDLMVFQYTVAGTICYRDNNNEQTVSAGSSLLFSYGEDTSYGMADGCSEHYVCEYVNLLGAGLAEHWRDLRQRHGSVIVFGDDVRAALKRLMVLADPRTVHDATVISTAVHAFVMLLYETLRRGQMARQSAVERAIDAIIAVPTHPWSLKEIADTFGCSREHLTRAFMRRLGSAPAPWLAQARVAKALYLLRETDLPLDDVARQSGFQSTHTLARQVRAETGASPTAWRSGVRSLESGVGRRSQDTRPQIPDRKK